MAERAICELRIGGKVTPEQFARIRGLALDEHAVQEFSVEEDHIRVWDPEAMDGEFWELEDYLEEQGIPFDRWSGSTEFDDAQFMYFRPGQGEIYVLSTVNGDRVLTEDDIAGCISQAQTKDDLIAALLEKLGEDVEPLPALEYEGPYE